MKGEEGAAQAGRTAESEAAAWQADGIVKNEVAVRQADGAAKNEVAVGVMDGAAENEVAVGAADAAENKAKKKGGKKKGKEKKDAAQRAAARAERAKKLRRLLELAHEAVFGKNCVCAACGEDVFDDGFFCAHCLAELPLNDGYVCSKCGRAIEADYPVCLECKAHMPLYDAARSAFRYEERVVGLIKRFKTGGRYLAAALAARMAPLLADSFPNADLIVSVPMTDKALKKRGYNQAELLADALSLRSGIPYAPAALVKTRDTAAQKHLTAAERAQNLAGSFRVHERALCRGRHVVIVDDVLTTGATADAVAKALRGAGAARVYVLTAASVPYRERPRTPEQALSADEKGSAPPAPPKKPAHGA